MTGCKPTQPPTSLQAKATTLAYPLPPLSALLARSLTLSMSRPRAENQNPLEQWQRRPALYFLASPSECFEHLGCFDVAHCIVLQSSATLHTHLHLSVTDQKDNKRNNMASGPVHSCIMRFTLHTSSQVVNSNMMAKTCEVKCLSF